MAMARVNGFDIFYADSGVGAPILWLQGLGAEHTAWTAQIARFSSEYRCIAPDARDIGRSERASSPYTLGDIADDMAALLESLGARPAHVVGLSLGGAVAQHLALHHPDAVASLCLVSTFGRQGPKQRELLSAWRDIYRQVDRVTFYRQANAWLFSDHFFERSRNVENVLRYVAESKHPQEPEAFTRQVEAALQHDLLDRLGGLTIPTMIVVGENDLLAPPHLARELAAAIPSARLEIMPDAAHSLNLERQTEFNRLVRGFLDSVH